MKATLTIKDLSTNKELDRKAMCAVRGGSSDQGIANQQFNGQAALVNSSIADGSKFCGPTNIQADTDVHQDADNYSYNDNFKALSLFGGLV